MVLRNWQERRSESREANAGESEQMRERVPRPTSEGKNGDESKNDDAHDQK